MKKVLVLFLVLLLGISSSACAELYDYAGLPDSFSTPKKTASPSPTFYIVPTQTIPEPHEIEPPIRDWSEYLSFPTREEIEAYNYTSTARSPYLGGWLDTKNQNYTTYIIQCKADYIPGGTYCCFANFDLTYPVLEKNYKNVHTDYNGVAGYAGLQQQLDGSTNSILSLWYIFFTDENGHEHKLRPTRLLPPEDGKEGFSGEGTGSQSLVPFTWKAGVWYEMLLELVDSPETGNSILQQWVRDLKSDRYTLQSRYDMGCPNVCFSGNIAVFLENYYPQTSGEIRTMECRNARIVTAEGQMVYLTDARFEQSYNYPGSYNYGADGSIFYMITTGVPNQGVNPGPLQLHVSPMEQ